MLSPPLLPCQHRIMSDVQITSTSDQYKVMQQLQKQFSGGAAPQFIHVSTSPGDYQPWHKELTAAAQQKPAYIGKVNSAYILGTTGGQRNICFPGPMIHESPLKTMEDSRKLHCGVISHNRTPAATCKSCYPTPPLPVSVDIPSHFMTPSSMSMSPACSPQRTLQTSFTSPAHGCGINSRFYEVPAPIETAELSLWSMRSHRYQPYSHHLPSRSSFSHTRGSPYTPHLLPPGPEQASPFSPVNQCNFVPGFPSGTSVQQAALLAFGDRLNVSSTITRRCARCRCPNCLSPTELRNANGKKEHICHFPNCGKVYGKTSHLKAHIRWHLGERPFVCNWLFCGKSFTRSDELQRHLRTHTGEKKFQCEICEKKFMRSDHLSKHAKIHKKKNLAVTEGKDSKDNSSSEEEMHGKLT